MTHMNCYNIIICNKMSKIKQNKITIKCAMKSDEHHNNNS